MIKLQIQPATHLIFAYNQMMESMRYAFDNSEIGEMTLQQALDAARHQAVHAGSVTAEEAYELGEHIKFGGIYIDVSTAGDNVLCLALNVAALHQNRQGSAAGGKRPIYDLGAFRYEYELRRS